jgi:hypothetical protein
MDENSLNQLARRLNELTPALINDLYTSFQVEPVLLQRYDSSNLRSMAEQGVVSFRDIVIGALQFDAPSVVSNELNWLDRLLHSRQLESDRVQIFLDIFRKRVLGELGSEESAPVLNLLDTTQKHLDEKRKSNEG